MENLRGLRNNDEFGKVFFIQLYLDPHSKGVNALQ